MYSRQQYNVNVLFLQNDLKLKNGFRCTDRRTVEKRNDKYCAMILERFGGCVQG